MRIGDEVYVHGYVDEIRKDVVIVRNEGGYFGTGPSEVVTYCDIYKCEECPRYADDCDGNGERKTESQTDMAEDIVRSYGFKAESYRQAKAKTEPQTDCSWK